MSFEQKYLKYKNKYLNLKSQMGGSFNSGDRFYYNGSLEGVENPQGTVLHKREMYGNTSGGTYMVKYDNPKITEHNASGDFMVKIDSNLPTNSSALVSDDKFKGKDRFYYNGSLEGVENPQGTVLHKREMYGNAFGGTYMVKYDNPRITEHNASGDFMVKI